MLHVAVFGTHPRLSLAEIRAVLPQKTAAPLLIGAAAIIKDETWDGAVLMQKLGGTVKLGDIHTECTIAELDAERIATLLLETPRDERIVYGLTVYGGTPALKRRTEKLGLEVKRVLKQHGKSARWVTSDEDGPLSPAAVAKLKLTTDGYDVLIVVHGERAFIGLTTHVQDADAWSFRDFGRPARDDENGMLPPKLARIMTNLARVPDDGILLDPFCGSGTILMEAALATHAKRIIGSDNDPRQIHDTNKNTAWLISQHVLRNEDAERFHVFEADARHLTTHLRENIDSVVTEGYLGPALRGNESADRLAKNAEEITELWRKTLQNIAPLVDAHARIVCVWPAMKTAHGTARVDLTPDLAKLGYELVNPLEGWEEANDPLLYHRPEQRVMRRIVILRLLA